MNKSRVAYKHISETVFMAQGHSASTLLTHYEIGISECATYQPGSGENIQQVYKRLFLVRRVSMCSNPFHPQMLFCSTPCFLMTLVCSRF